MALALIVAAQKLRPYFQAHSIEVLTNCHLKHILQKPKVSGRLTKCAIELSEFDVSFKSQTAIKGQAIVDFIVEFTEPIIDIIFPAGTEESNGYPWKLHVDGSSNSHGSGAGVVLTTPDQDEVECALRFDFKATNNVAEYEALLAGLRVATALGADKIDIFSDSQLVVNQICNEYQAKKKEMIAYLEKTRQALGRFTKFRITQIPRAENLKADALSKLALATNVMLSKTVQVAHLLQPSICEEDVLMVAEVNLAEVTWITPIRAYLEQGIFPEDKNEAKRLRY
ncbi:hypothetical protein ACOSP7_023200 [Xanthoceras sorbifolium]